MFYHIKQVVFTMIIKFTTSTFHLLQGFKIWTVKKIQVQNIRPKCIEFKREKEESLVAFAL